MKTLKLQNEAPSETQIMNTLGRRLARAGLIVARINGGILKTPGHAFVRSYIIFDLLDDNGRPTSKGFPDLLVLRPTMNGAQAFLIEVKSEAGELTPEQQKFHAWAKRRGIEVIVVEGWESMNRVSAHLTRCERQAA